METLRDFWEEYWPIVVGIIAILAIISIMLVGIISCTHISRGDYTKAMVRNWYGVSDEFEIVDYVEFDDTYELTTTNGLTIKVAKEDCRLFGGNA